MPLLHVFNVCAPVVLYVAFVLSLFVPRPLFFRCSRRPVFFIKALADNLLLYFTYNAMHAQPFLDVME